MQQVRQWGLTLAVLLCAATAMAQSYRRTGDHVRYNIANETYIGLRLGLNLATVNSDNTYLDGDRSRAGLNVGVAAGIQLANDTPIFLEGGLFYTEKGGKGHYYGNRMTYSLNYLEVPLVIKYHFDFDEYGISLQPFFGGFVAVGVDGRIKNYGLREASSAFSDDAFRRVDAGLRLGCGLQWEHLYLESGYEFGLANISHDTFDSSHTGNFFLTAGANF